MTTSIRSAQATPRRSSSFAIWVLIGVACGIAGMLPWLIHGARLIVQNLWATPTVDPAQMPIVLLPFSQYQLVFVAGVVVIGSAIAGITARILAARGARNARTGLALGVIVIQLVALVQTGTAVAAGLRHPVNPLRMIDESLVYLAVMTAWIIAAIVAGAVVFLLVSRPRTTVFALGIATAAVVLEAWLRGFAIPIMAVTPHPSALMLFLVHWVPAMVVGAAIAWAGVGSRRRIIAAVAALLVLWLGSAAMTATASAAGSRALLRLPGELLGHFGSVFLSGLRDTAGPLVLVAAGIAIVGLGVRWALARGAVVSV